MNKDKYIITIMILIFFMNGCKDEVKSKLENITPVVLPTNTGKLIISEVMAVNAHTKMDPDFFAFSDWIELHNQTDNDIDISNYQLSDKLNEGVWTIPSGTTISSGEYLVFWADGKDSVQNGYHTNFKLKSKGEAIALFSAKGDLVDGFEFPKQEADISCALKDDKIVYMYPTPKAKNDIAIDNLSLTLKPIFSVNSGFYMQPQNVTLSTENGAKIYYTTNGSFPDKNSSIYNEPFSIDNTTVIRARAIEDGKLFSAVSTQTYFINENTTLPIISIAMDDNYLFDDKVGIYTTGTNGAPTPACAEGPAVANFYQKWKRPANIEYFDTNKELGFSLELDIKISGSCSRVLPQKSLSVKADSKYGKKSIDYELFPNKDISEFKGFKIKSAGQDWYTTMIRDAFMQQVIKDSMDVDYQDYRPAIVFINGKYWGIHNIREKKNEDFLAENHSDVDNNNKIDILQDNMGSEKGSSLNYEEMISYIEEQGVVNNDNYSEVATKMDIENYIDYIIAQTYFANVDWPYTNVRYWRERKDNSKWRWILEDLDLGLGQWNQPIEINMFSLITETENLVYQNPLWSTFLFRSLLENINFKNRFKEKYFTYLDSTFKTDRVLSILDNLTQAIRSEIPRHSAKWGDTDTRTFKDLAQWEINVEYLKDVIKTRNSTVRNELILF